jgi:hypothetical protein
VSENYPKLKYSEKQLELFLDSIGQLPISQWEQQARHQSDSIFYGQKQLSTKLSKEDHQKMLDAAKTGWIEEALAYRYKWEYDRAMVHEGKIDISFFPLDSNKEEPDKFAFCFGPPAGNWADGVYFFDKNLCLAKHYVNHRYGLELEYYLDVEGKTVVYYKEDFASGTGIWWSDFFCYRFDSEELIPILNELEFGNLSFSSSRQLKSTIVDTNPLTLKMVYSFTIEDAHSIINDSTLVRYHWDATSKKLKGDYEHGKLSKTQILSFNLATDELFFIRAHRNFIRKNFPEMYQLKRIVCLYIPDEYGYME